MKILIQQADTGLYLSADGRWGKNPQEALAFLDELRARDYCIYRRIKNYAVVVVNNAPSSSADAPSAEVLSIGNQTEQMKRKNIPAVAGQTKQPATSVPAPAKGKPAPVTSAAKPAPVVTPVPAKVVVPTPAVVQAVKPVAPVKPMPQPVPVAAPAAKPALAVAPVPAQPVAAAAPGVKAVEPSVPVKAAPAKAGTTVQAKIDVGFGNALFIRGEGAGLSWDKGVLMQCKEPSTWVWLATNANGPVLFKVLLNDQVWAAGENLTLQPGQRIEIQPVF